MDFDRRPSVDDNETNWSDVPAGILLMGKRQGTKRENRQLWGRVAMGAALWYSAAQPKPYLMFVAADRHGAWQKPDAEVVKSMLVNDFGISADYVILRCLSNCTLIEVRVARMLKRVYGLGPIFAVTHLYHAPRTQRYLNEVLPDGSVIPVHPDILTEMNFPAAETELLATLRQLIVSSLPTKPDLMREQVIEWFLNTAHTVDPMGSFERRLAKLLRPGR